MAGKNEVELSSKVNFKGVLEVFSKLGGESNKLKDTFKKAGKEIGDDINNMIKGTENFLGKVGNMARRTADQMKEDFKALASLNAIKESLKLSEQFRGSIKESFELADSIRKLSRVFGLAEGDFAKFQSSMVKGLGEIGLSSEVATKTLEGLAETPVRAKGALIEYAKVSGQLASVSKTKGSEGEIAQGMARVLEARGVNPNDVGAMKSVAEDLRRVFNQTGKGPKDTLHVMEDLFTNMSSDFRQKVSTRGLSNLAAVAQVSGPNSTKFLEEFLGKSPIARKAMEAQGFKGVVGDKGLDIDKFKKASDSILARVGGDPRMAAQTLGLSDEAAEGFVRLTEHLDQARKAQDAVNNATGNLDDQFVDTLSALEGFKGSIEHVKAMLSGPFSEGIEKVTKLLGEASQSKLGSAAVVAGGGILAAMLAGGGLRGAAKSLAKEKAYETVTGEKIVPVKVMNFDEMPSSGLPGTGEGGGKLGTLAKVTMAGTVAAAGISMVPKDQGSRDTAWIEKHIGKTAAEVHRQTMNAMATGLNKVGFNFSMIPKVHVTTDTRDLKATTQPTRGASQ